MNHPWLSVIMPTYNGAAYLPSALESIASQDFRGTEVIAIDDGSVDTTLSILDSYRDRLPLRLVPRAHTGNWVVSTNLALSLARGRWVCFLHQDDVWMPNRLALLRPLAQRPDGVALIVHPSWFIDRCANRLGLWRCPLPMRQAVHSSRRMVERLLVQNFIAIAAPLFPLKLALEVGGLDQELWYTADWDFWLKLAARGSTLYVPDPLTGFRIHSLSQTAQRSCRADEMRRQLHLVLNRHLASLHLSSPPPQPSPRWWEGEGGGDEGERMAGDPWHSTPLSPTAGERMGVRGMQGGLSAVARFAADLNVCLAAGANGLHADWLQLFRVFAALGPSGWRRFFRDSRIIERLGARLRARAIFGR